MSIIDDVLKTRGIKDISELTPEERTTFAEWDRVLSEGSLTVDKIAEFCRLEMSRIDAIWRTDVASFAPGKNERLITMRMVYGSMLDLIEGPKKSRETLEVYLKGLVDSI